MASDRLDINAGFGSVVSVRVCEWLGAAGWVPWLFNSRLHFKKAEPSELVSLNRPSA